MKVGKEKSLYLATGLMLPPRLRLGCERNGKSLKIKPMEKEVFFEARMRNASATHCAGTPSVN